MKPWVRKVVGLGCLIGIAFWAIPKPVLLEHHRFSQVFRDKTGGVLRLEMNQDEKFRLFVPLEQIASEAVDAALLQEDQHFFRHFGVNPASLMRGLWNTYGSRSRRMGGSTLTMQVARMRFHIDSATPWGKIEQILRAFQLERHYPKRDILEAYLNLAPYGANIEGIGAAALIYFQKTPQKISLPEALTLSVIPQNPQKRNPLKLSPTDIIKARERLFDRWVAKYPWDEFKRPWMSLPFQVHTRTQLPFLAPHLVNQLREQKLTQRDITTTLDRPLQLQLEQLVRNYVERLSNRGVDNAAALLVDHRDMSVIALVGSADFFDEVIEGQVNGTNAPRSPGSTLKPFIYALALDHGLIHPKSMLKDAPMSFKGYNPENLDGTYRGPITATNALVTSRNIPAIYLNNRLGDKDLYAFLKNADHPLLKPKDHYGLALVLGGSETTAQKLAQLYGILVNKGNFQPLRFLKNAPMEKPTPLLSPESAYLTLEMLEQGGGAHEYYFARTPDKLPVYWKTGTSNGYRDGWVAGIFGPYILVVWIGSFDGSSHPLYTGFDGAKPLFFEIVNALSHAQALQDTVHSQKSSLNLISVPVCASTGDLALESCRSLIHTSFIPGKSPIARSKVRRKLLIDLATGLQACRFELGKTIYETFEFWPSDLMKIYADSGFSPKAAPPFHPSCPQNMIMDHQKPEITSPKEGVVYSVRLTGPKTPVPLSAVTDSTIHTIFWFSGTNLLGKSTPNAPFFWSPTPGTYTIRAVDDQGQSDTRTLRVQGIE